MTKNKISNSESPPSPPQPFFEDRSAGGIALAAKLAETLGADDLDDPLVLGAVRGGVPVAYQVASALDLPLDVFVVRKLRAEGDEAIAMGAVAPGHARYVNYPLVDHLAIPIDFLDAAIAREEGELQRLVNAFHEDRPFARIKDRTIILVDDGIVSGSTISAALLSLRSAGAHKIIVATPVSTAAGKNIVSKNADAVIALEELEPGTALHTAYTDFVETAEADVHACLGSWELDPPAKSFADTSGHPPPKPAGL